MIISSPKFRGLFSKRCTHFPVHHQSPSCWNVLWRSLTVNRHKCVSTSKETLFQNSNHWKHGSNRVNKSQLKATIFKCGIFQHILFSFVVFSTPLCCSHCQCTSCSCQWWADPGRYSGQLLRCWVLLVSINTAWELRKLSTMRPKKHFENRCFSSGVQQGQHAIGWHTDNYFSITLRAVSSFFIFL